jgi:hypothetical protein
MTEENAGGGADATPVVDAFGSPVAPEGGDTQPKDGGTKETEDKGGEGKEKSNEVVALETKLEEYSKNLSGQNSVIDQLKQKIAVLESGGKGGEGDGEGGEGDKPKVLFEEIKYSKDLPEEQREDMTETEIQLFDANARQQEAMNKMFETIQNSNKQVEDVKVENLNTTAQSEATKLAEEAFTANSELAKDAKELADKILVEFKEFNNENITPEKLQERMKKALNNVSGYTPPKEEVSNKDGGKPAGGKGGNDADPFGNQAIVDSVGKKSDGSYAL